VYPRTMRELDQLTREIAAGDPRTGGALRYLYHQQRHYTNQAELVRWGRSDPPAPEFGWPLPPREFATPLIEPSAYEARVTQLFFGRPGMIVQVALHEYIPSNYQARRAIGDAGSAALSWGWHEHDGLWLDLQFVSVAAAQQAQRALRPVVNEVGVDLKSFQAASDSPARCQLVAWMRPSRVFKPVVALRALVEACDPYLATAFEGDIDLHGSANPHHFPPPDEAFWRHMPLPQRQWLECQAGGRLVTS
jgi:hypothetical protein